MMDLDEAIYCLESYQPDAADDMCQKCKYYSSKQIDEQTSVCKSSEARKVAISAIEQIKAIRVLVECCENVEKNHPDDKDYIIAAKITAYENIVEVLNRKEN